MTGPEMKLPHYDRGLIMISSANKIPLPETSLAVNALKKIFQRLLAPLALLLILLAQPVASANSDTLDLPDMGDSSATILSADEDKQLGQAFMRSLRQQVDIIDDPGLNAYINALGYRLLGSANTELSFTFFIVDDSNINAFAGPGGYIGIHSGLILSAKTEGELAAVLAHEIAHVTQRHLARAFKKASTTSLQAAAAILAALIVGSPEVAEAALALALAAPLQQQLNFTRAHEKEADRVGIDILAGAGYDPQHMPAFFYNLQQAHRYMKSSLPELLRTHPVTHARISDSTNRAEQYPKKSSYLGNKNFGLIQAKLHTLSSDSQHRMKILESAIESGDDSPKTIYEYALWQLQHGNVPEAQELTEALLSKSAEQHLYISLMAQIESKQAQPKLAEKRLKQALELYPQHPLLTVQYVNTLLELAKAPEAAKIMRELIQHLDNFALPSYYQLLAKSETAAEMPSNAYQTMAEYYYLIGHTRIAVDQLEMALKETSAKDDFNQARIKARLDEFKEIALEEERMEQKGP